MISRPQVDVLAERAWSREGGASDTRATSFASVSRAWCNGTVVEVAGPHAQVVAAAFEGGRPGDPAGEARAASELKARLLGAPRGPEGERYRVVRCVGVGGAGDVYEAWDEELRRRVAIKVLRASVFAGDREAHARARLIREAQAIARVAHPNLVAVFDVGTCTPAMRKVLNDAADSAVFIGMEYVDGFTLREWIERERPSLREILAAFAAAAGGLAAVHASGLVHRDFKPRNVMVTAEGRVCVLDFGLARAAPDEAETTAARRLESAEPAQLDELTDPGVVMGTPGYMAPEQHRGDPPDPRTDQFAFGVSLWEAIFGERPFHGRTLGELRLATQHPPALPSSRRVPRWLVGVLRRTLAADPHDRFPSMDAVARALDRGLRPRRRAFAWATIAAVALVGVAVGSPVPSPAGCDATTVSGPPADELDALAAAFMNETRGSEVLPRVQTRIEAYERALTSAAHEACEMQDDGHRAVAMMCLQQRAAGLQATTTVLASADATIVQHALELLAELPSIAACLRPDAPPAWTPGRDPERARQLMRADALRSAGKYDAARILATQVAADARRVADEPSLARAEIVLGRVALMRPGVTPEQAELHLRAALAAAESVGDDEAAADALTLLVHTVGPVAGRFVEADLFAEQARAKLARLGHPPQATAALEQAIGLLRYRQHAFDDALAAYDAARSLLEMLYGADEPAVAHVRVEIGNTLVQLGRHRDAESPRGGPDRARARVGSRASRAVVRRRRAGPRRA